MRSPGMDGTASARQSTARPERFVDDMTDYAIVILDVHGRVLTWNASARALLGHASDGIVGRATSSCRAMLPVAHLSRRRPNCVPADVQFLAKPYRMRELVQKIEEVLKTTS